MINLQPVVPAGNGSTDALANISLNPFDHYYTDIPEDPGVYGACYVDALASISLNPFDHYYTLCTNYR